MNQCVVVVVLRQACQLGKHRPICKSYAEGIVKVGAAEERGATEQPLSDWFLKMTARDGNNDAFSKLKLFAQVCRYDLGTDPSTCFPPSPPPRLVVAWGLRR